ncbi:peptidoglycan D,D-transpeptidase FtsI family protein [Paenibacillus beijingensis]|uniref:Cell division protein FtsI n=1 Tax=Paenibacillus beijingensis TaxID=1126833 RepID=A0A0D5NKU7_9BACL|nr:penicillin-binding transpeptidase domain-containing protein [Paenibacillus beijingensis]AJY75745.1 cell division protein FtsI [Paenibacillus beijingensis]
MHEDDPQKRDVVNRRNFSLRLNVFFFAAFFLFSVLIVRLAILQFVEGPSLSKEESSMGTRNVKIPPIRGDIYDSSGYPIAYSTSTQSLYFTIQTGFKTEEAKSLANKLEAAFTKYGNPAKAMTVDDIIRQMDLGFKQNTVSVPRRIKSGLTNEEIAYFSEHRDEFPSIDIVEESVRNYDKSTIAVQLVGYLKKYRGVKDSVDKYKEMKAEEDPKLQYLDDEEVGMDGLEMLYQDVLRGKNGLKSYPVNAASRIIGPVQITNPERGDDLYLTLNKNVQMAAEQAITDQLYKLKHATSVPLREGNQATTGYAVAMEVKTGKVIAMASMPDYDPNVWSGGKISQEDLKNIQYFQSNGAIRQVYPPYDDAKQRNRHPSSLVPLGSTQKPLTVLIGLKEDLYSTDFVYHDSGVFSFGKKGYQVSVRNSSNHAYGPIDPAMSIAHSSNTFMSEMIGNKLYMKYGRKGVDIWDGYVKQFGLGVSTESGLPGESKGVVDYYHEADSGSAQSALIYASFGQQGRYTALQLAQYAAALGSRGKRMQPQFVNEIKDADGNVVQSFKPKVLNSVTYPDSYWNEIFRGMSKVSVQGFDGANYSFLRKTGTSEQDVGDRKKVENAVFIALAPAENPVIAVSVVIPDGGFGGYGAAPVARQIIDAYDDYIGLNGTPRKAANAPASGGAAGNASAGTAPAGTAATGTANTDTAAAAGAAR